MSLIQEALQKVGKVSAEPSQTEPVQTDPLPASKPEPNRFFKLRWDVKTVTFLMMLGFAGLFWIFQGRRVPPPPAPAKPKANLSSLIPTLQLPSKMRLSGITFSDGIPLALINDRIVGVGDMIDGHTRVKAIYDRNVVLDFHGSEISLSLNP